MPAPMTSHNGANANDLVQRHEHEVRARRCLQFAPNVCARDLLRKNPQKTLPGSSKRCGRPVNNCALAVLVIHRAVIQVAEGNHALASLVRCRVIVLGYGRRPQPRAIPDESLEIMKSTSRTFRIVDFP
jgi:hypothetical protein